MCPHGLVSHRLCSGVSFYVSWPFSIKMEERIVNTTANYFIVFDWNEMGGDVCGVRLRCMCVCACVVCVNVCVCVCGGDMCICLRLIKCEARKDSTTFSCCHRNSTSNRVVLFRRTSHSPSRNQLFPLTLYQCSRVPECKHAFWSVVMSRVIAYGMKASLH